MAEFGAKSTAEEVSRGIDLTGRRAIVTGANTGIGRETARVLALRGAEVVMACRDLDRAGRARDELLAESNGQIAAAQLVLAQLDLAHFESVRGFAKEQLAGAAPIHLLINNAGVMNFERRTTSDGFEAHFGTNHLGHFLLTNLLLPRLRESAPSRVVVVSSDAMHMSGLDAALSDLNWEERKYSGWRSYGSSKLMNLIFAAELERRESDNGLVANALHPGIVATELAREPPLYMKIVGVLALPFRIQPEVGAATTVHLATAPEHASGGGGYFSKCQPARTPGLASDEDAAKRLWALSERLTGLVP
jgi:NAD(P)-dependent dehydrogenase (short-subunit alcohol dehydrogenase family)